jgi:hypothetical protein
MPQTQLGPGLKLFGGFCCLIAVALAISGATTAHARARQISTWPTATARVRTCGIDGHHAVNRGTSITYTVSCQVAYAVQGHEVVAWAKSTPRPSGRNGMNFALSASGLTVTNPAKLFDDWMAHHRRGSQITIRYDPATPDKPSFLGTDPVLDVDPGTDTQAGVLVFGVLGLVAWAAGSWLSMRPPINVQRQLRDLP